MADRLLAEVHIRNVQSGSYPAVSKRRACIDHEKVGLPDTLWVPMVMAGVLPDICFNSVSPLRFGYGFSLVCASSMLSGDRASLVFGTGRDVRPPSRDCKDLHSQK